MEAKDTIDLLHEIINHSGCFNKKKLRNDIPRAADIKGPSNWRTWVELFPESWNLMELQLYVTAERSA
jgi:hypothetical protein